MTKTSSTIFLWQRDGVEARSLRQKGVDEPVGKVEATRDAWSGEVKIGIMRIKLGSSEFDTPLKAGKFVMETVRNYVGGKCIFRNIDGALFD